jgi:hypothetical protein
MPSLFIKSPTEKQTRSNLLKLARRSVKNIFNSQIIPMEMIYSQKQPKVGKIVKAEKLTQTHSPMQIEESSRRAPLSRKLNKKGGKGGKRKSRKARRSMKSHK